MKNLKLIIPFFLLILSIFTLAKVKSGQAEAQLDGLCMAIGSVTTVKTVLDEETARTLKSYIRAWESAHDTKVALTIYSQAMETDGTIVSDWVSYRDRLENPPVLYEPVLSAQSGAVQVMASSAYRSNIPLLSWHRKTLQVNCMMKPRKSMNIPVDTESGTLRMEDL